MLPKLELMISVNVLDIIDIDMVVSNHKDLTWDRQLILNQQQF